jgi:UDP-glucose/iron transport system permease protein
MDSNDIGWWGIAGTGVLVLATVALTAWRHLGLGREILWASVRMAVQLGLVGLALHLVLDEDDPIALSFLWVAAMIGFAAWTVQRRAPGVPGALRIAALAFTCAALATLGVLFGLRIFDLSGRTLVPLAGMMIGNSLSTTVLAAKRLVAEADEHRDLIEARLALGQPPTKAFAPHLRATLRTALIPQIETTKAVGIVFLPGAMVGLVLAGADPMAAVRVQAAVMYLVLVAVAITTTVTAIGVSRLLFTPDKRLASPPATV